MRKEIRSSMIGLTIFYIALGLVMIIWPEQACKIACYALGAALMIFGLFRIFEYLQTRGAELVGGNLFVGIFSILTGLLIILRASVVVSILVAIMGILVIGDSIVKLSYSRMLRKMDAAGWKIGFISACVMLVLGVFMLFDPFESAKTMIVFAGIFLLLDAAGNLFTIIQASRYLK